MAEKLRSILCDPLKCFGVFFTINALLFSLCATGYWNLDKKIDTVNQNILAHMMDTRNRE